MTKAQKDFRRDISLDLIRFIAMLMVVCIHIAAKGFYVFPQPHWWAVNLYDSVSRVAVPLFFMVTGALLLPREQTVNSILVKVGRVGLPLIVWSLAYLMWYRYNGVHNKGWLTMILREPVAAHLWYVYTLIGAYLFLPVMAGFFNFNNLKVKIFTLTCWFLGVSVLPLANHLAGRALIGISWEFLSLYAGYMVLGAIIYKNIALTKKIFAFSFALYIAAAMLIAILTWRYSIIVGQAHELFYIYSSPFVVLGAIGLFGALQFIGNSFIKEGGALYKFLIFQGKASFGVYLVHVLVIFAVDAFTGLDYKFINPWLAIPLMTVLIFSLSMLIIKIIQSIPILRIIAPS